MILPKLRRDQYEIAMHPAKTKVLGAGRRWGKTVMGGVLCGNVLAKHGRVAWIAPTYKNTRPLWRWLLMATAADVKAKRMRISRAEHSIETDRGGFLGLYSADNMDSIRGEAFHLVVIDEAARTAEDGWTDAVMPTLADFNGDAFLISTPKGKNWFWQEFQRGQADGRDTMSWQCPTSDNPNLQIRRAAVLVQERVSEHTYRQEWLAEFLEGGEVFRRIRELATAQWQNQPADGHHYVMGVDLARKVDFTVCIVLDTSTQPASMVYLDRFNQVDWAIQVSRIKALAERFKVGQMIVDQTGVGDPIVQELQTTLNIGVSGYQFTNATKTQAIDALALAFEKGNIAILNDSVLIAELQAYEMEKMPSGLMRYNAPAGMHDDCVMSLALAWQGISGGSWWLA